MRTEEKDRREEQERKYSTGEQDMRAEHESTTGEKDKREDRRARHQSRTGESRIGKQHT